MFQKGKHIVALDLGSHSLKMMCLKEGRRGRSFFTVRSRRYRASQQSSGKPPKLIAFGLTRLPPGTIGEGGISNEDSLIESIRTLADHLDIRRKNNPLVLALTGYEVMIKRVALPMMTEDELEARMNEEFSQYIPYPVSEVNIDYEIMGEARNNPKQMEVMLVAAKRDVVDDYVRVIRRVGFEPAVIDVDFFALSNAFEVSYGVFPDKSLGLVHIGASKTSVSVVNQGVLTFTQDLPLGGEQINDSIRTRFDRFIDDPERIKLGGDPGFRDKVLLAEIYQDVARSWVSNLQRILQFYYKNYQEKQLDMIYLSGGPARIPGLSRFFQKQTGITTQIFNPLKYFASDRDRFDPQYVDSIGPQMAVCVGLGLRTVS